MNDERMGQLYQEIAQMVISMIPEQWRKVIIYAEVAEGSQNTYFYYYPNSGEPVYSHDIPENFEVNESKYMSNLNSLLDLFQDLQAEFKDNENGSWTSLSMFFDSTGKFNIDYNYDDLSSTDPHERKTIWKYTHLGIEPKSHSGRKFLERYLATLDKTQ